MSARPASPCFDDKAIERAEAAMKALSINFDEWMATEIDRLEAARAAVRQHDYSDQALDTLYMRAHDVKGVGTTYGFPLVTAIAAQLCRLLDNPQGRAAARETPALVDAHVDGVRAIVRADLRAPDDPIGLALVAELRSRVNRWANTNG